MRKGKISILIPAYNEEKAIVCTVVETIKVLEKLEEDYEIIIIDDGSNDNTYSYIKKNLKNFNSKVIIKRYAFNEGKGFAIKHGCNYISGDYVLFLDADMDLHPSHIDNFLSIIKKEKADLVIGSKRHKNSVVEYPFTRKVLSSGYYFLIRILFGLPVKDTQTGFKLFKSKTLKKCISKIIIKKYAFDLELLVVIHKYKYKIIEGPIYLKPKRRYYNRIGLKDIYRMFIDTIAVFYRLKFLRYYD